MSCTSTHISEEPGAPSSR